MIYCWRFLFCVLPFICIVGEIYAHDLPLGNFCWENFDCEKFNSSAKSNRENFNNLSLRQNFNNPLFRHKKIGQNNRPQTSGKLSHPINAMNGGKGIFNLPYYTTTHHAKCQVLFSVH